MNEATNEAQKPKRTRRPKTGDELRKAADIADAKHLLKLLRAAAKALQEAEHFATETSPSVRLIVLEEKDISQLNEGIFGNALILHEQLLTPHQVRRRRV